MKNTTITISSDSDSCSDDDVPLKVLKQNGCVEDPNSYESLCQHSIEACEFCDSISKNRYSSLIHNVRHIIIPLLNQTVFQCPTCLHHFTSENDLRIHSLKKHLDLNTIAQVPLVRNEVYGSNEYNSSQYSGWSDTKEIKTQAFNHINSISQSENSTKKEETRIESIKNRLVFEDDDVTFLDCNQLLNDLTTDCKVNIELFNTPLMNGDEYSGRSVHYDELIKPGVYRCRKCGKGFPIRYDAIIHESSHIRFKNSQVRLCVICKKYVIGDRNGLRRHYLIFHKEKKQEHQYPMKRILFEENLERKTVCNSKVLSLCELCFSFCKSGPQRHYKCIKTISTQDKQFQCEKCDLLFCEIKFVRVRRFVQSKAYTPAPKKRKTNEERLKTITQRFKKMKY